MVGQFKPRRRSFPFALLGILALLATLPATAGAARKVQVQQDGQTYRVVVRGNPTASDLKAIKTASYRPSQRTGAMISSHLTWFCGRSVRSGEACGSVPTDFNSSNGAEYRGRGTVRVCAISARANHFYPNGDPRYAWVGSCGNNVAGVGMPGYMYSYNNDGNWVNNTVVNASPWTHTIWEHINFLPFSTAGVCWFEVQC
jgi:hypothetical protein